MDEREAKDFLVQQAAEQAAIEGVPLSDLEKRMMYFTESGYVPEDPIKLNEEFEAKYDTDTYEEKLTTLFKNAQKRIFAGSEAKREMWNEAIRVLSGGDHYILLMCGDMGLVPVPSPSIELSTIPLASWLMLIGRSAILGGVALGFVSLINYLAKVNGISSYYIYLGLFLVIYLVAVLRGELLKRAVLSVIVFLVRKQG